MVVVGVFVVAELVVVPGNNHNLLYLCELSFANFYFNTKHTNNLDILLLEICCISSERLLPLLLLVV